MNVAPMVLFMLVAGSVSGAAFATDSLGEAFRPGQQQCFDLLCAEGNQTQEPGNETSEPEQNDTSEPPHRHSNETSEPEQNDTSEPEHRHGNDTTEPESNSTAHGGCPAYGLQEDGCTYLVDDQSDLALHAGGFWQWEVMPSTESIRISIATDGLFGTDLFASQGTFMELRDGNGDLIASFSDDDLHLFEGQYSFELDLSELEGDDLVLGEWTLWFEDCFLVGSYHIVIEVLCEDPES